MDAKVPLDPICECGMLASAHDVQQRFRHCLKSEKDVLRGALATRAPIAEMTRAWRDLHQRIDADEISTAKAAELWVEEFQRYAFPRLPEGISDAMVEEVEQGVGMGRGAWDMVDPKEIILRAWLLVATIQQHPVVLPSREAVADLIHGFFNRGLRGPRIDRAPKGSDAEKLADLILANWPLIPTEN